MSDDIDIKKVRRAVGLNQVELGLLLGVHHLTVSRWERGVIFPSPYQVVLLERLQKNVKRWKRVKSDLLRFGPIEMLRQLLK